jgi:xanthine dehydrogenase accessory factor
MEPVIKQSVFQALAAAASSGEPVSLGIITTVKGSSPQKVGAKALFYADGRIHGTMGGGCLEAEIQQRAVQALKTNKPAVFDLLLDHDFGWDDGLICGGKVCGVILPNAQYGLKPLWEELGRRQSVADWGITRDFSILKLESDRDQSSASSNLLYLETVSPPGALWIAGAGHIAQSVAPLAVQLDFDVTVFDDRPALANRSVFSEPINIQADVWENLLKHPLPNRPAFALIVTRGHRHDALVLKEWITRPFLFLGMIGSSRKARTIMDHFRSEKIATEAQLSRIACPVGINIQSQSVAEIAVSIMAQFIEKRAELMNNRKGTGAGKIEIVER